MMGNDWSDGLWMGVAMFVFWGGIIALIALAIRGGRNSATGDRHHHHSPGAREILEERFAKGEISEDEFQVRRQVLAQRRNRP